MSQNKRSLLSYIVRLGAQILGLPFYWLSGLMPRNERLWLFGEWEGWRYADNARYLYEHVLDDEAVLAVWISKDRRIIKQLRSEGKRAFHSSSITALFLKLRASVCVFTHNVDDVGGVFTRGATLINLTHATPIKKIALDARSRRFGLLTNVFDRQIRMRLPAFRRPDRIFAASEYAIPRYISAYGMPRNKVIATGYARWAPFARPLANDTRRLKERLATFSEVYLYAPTHRNSGRTALAISEIDGFSAFCSWLLDRNIALLVRPHPALTIADRSGLDAIPNVFFVDSEIVSEANDLVKIVDLLITDYSSLVFDYAVLRRKFVMLAFDLKQYSKVDAGLYGDYEKEFYPWLATDWNGVSNIVQSSTEDGWREFIDIHAKWADGNEAKRIANLIKSVRNAKP